MAGSNSDSFFIESILNSIDDLNRIDQAVAAQLRLPPYPSFEDLLRHDQPSSSGRSNTAQSVTSNVHERQRLSMGQDSQYPQCQAISARATSNMPAPQRQSMGQGSQYPQTRSNSARAMSNTPIPQGPPMGQGSQHHWRAAAQPTNPALPGSRDFPGHNAEEDAHQPQQIGSQSTTAFVQKNHPLANPHATRRIQPLPRRLLPPFSYPNRPSNIPTPRRTADPLSQPTNPFDIDREYVRWTGRDQNRQNSAANKTATDGTNMGTNDGLLTQPQQTPLSTNMPLTNTLPFKHERVSSSPQGGPVPASRSVSQAPAISNLNHHGNKNINASKAVNVDQEGDATNVMKPTKRKSDDGEENDGPEDVQAKTAAPARKRQRSELARLPGTSKELPGFPSSKEPLPTDWTLELIVTEYPNHTLVPEVLDAFTQYFWTGGDIYKRFSPEVCRAWDQVFPTQPGNALHKRLMGRWRRMGDAALTDLINGPKMVRCFANGRVYFGKSNPGNLDLNPIAPRKAIKNE